MIAKTKYNLPDNVLKGKGLLSMKKLENLSLLLFPEWEALAIHFKPYHSLIEI